MSNSCVHDELSYQDYLVPYDSTNTGNLGPGFLCTRCGGILTVPRFKEHEPTIAELLSVFNRAIDRVSKRENA